MPATLPPEAVEAVARLLYDNGAAALAWRRLRSSPQIAVLSVKRLQMAYRYYALEATVHERQLAETIKELRLAGVDPVITKGWAVARLYPEPGLRPYRDIDLSILPEDVAVARQTLGLLGEPACPVELHPGFADLPDRLPANLHARATEAQLGDQSVRVMCPEDELRHLCIHMLRHGATRPAWLCDIALILETLPPGFDWDYCLHGDARRTEWVRCALGLAGRLLGADLSGTPAAGKEERLPSWLVPAVLRQWGTNAEVLYTVRTHLANRSGLIRAVRQRWPNPIRATVRVNGPFDERPRLPYQVAYMLRLARAAITNLTRDRPIAERNDASKPPIVPRTQPPPPGMR